MLNRLKDELYKSGNKDRSLQVSRYFKTGKGDYGEGDIFLGITNPDLRKIIKPYIFLLPLEDVVTLLKSEEHEFRLAALIIFVERFRKNPGEREQIVTFYSSHTDYINNWDLVDSSAHKILGPWLESRDRSILYDFALSGNLWKERISVITTLYFIKNGDFKDILKLSSILLGSKEDLIHKAVGWMLREVGKISLESEENYLKDNYKKMPRTMLRYAIEKFPPEKRESYLKGRV